jgi:hypothetical protein
MSSRLVVIDGKLCHGFPDSAFRQEGEIPIFIVEPAVGWAAWRLLSSRASSKGNTGGDILGAEIPKVFMVPDRLIAKLRQVVEKCGLQRPVMLPQPGSETEDVGGCIAPAGCGRCQHPPAG